MEPVPGCGVVKRLLRIVGCKETEVNEYPWQAYLLKYMDESRFIRSAIESGACN